MSKRGNIKGWITVNGVHIPIMEGQSKQEAYEKAFTAKRKVSKEDQKFEDRWQKEKEETLAKMKKKDTSSSINAKYDKKQEELYNRLGKKDTIAARQDYDREYNRLERARKRELDKLNNKVKTNSSTKSIPDSAMSAKTSKERRHNLQKYFYDQPKGSKIKVNGITYTKQDNSPGGLWKSKDGNHYSEDLIKEYAHYRKK